MYNNFQRATRQNESKRISLKTSVAYTITILVSTRDFMLGNSNDVNTLHNNNNNLVGLKAFGFTPYSCVRSYVGVHHEVIQYRRPWMVLG